MFNKRKKHQEAIQKKEKFLEEQKRKQRQAQLDQHLKELAAEDRLLTAMGNLTNCKLALESLEAMVLSMVEGDASYDREQLAAQFGAAYIDFQEALKQHGVASARWRTIRRTIISNQVAQIESEAFDDNLAIDREMWRDRFSSNQPTANFHLSAKLASNPHAGSGA